MIKYFMRKTIYKEYDLETQNSFLQLVSRKHIIQLLCLFSWFIIVILPIIPLCIIVLCENPSLAIKTSILVCGYFALHVIACGFMFTHFGKAMFVCSNLIASKIYFQLCTTKGNALSKQDFETIRVNNRKLFDFISTQQCISLCYSICFEILKVLKKGYLEFAAIKKFSFEKEEKNDDGRDFTMHVLYINNGWAFDTYSAKQYPVEELHQIYNAKVYKTCDFNDIKDKSYEAFRDEQEPALAEWCNANDCSQFLKEKVT